jgi:elongator complex protein 2
MILDCVWAPQQAGNIFATAGRDKTVKVWKFTDGKVNILHSMTANAAVTAVSFDQSDSPDVLRLAYGTEDGIICITDISVPDMSQLSMTSIERSIRPSATVNTLSWRPGARQLAAGSDDTSVRIFELSVG